ncbi:DoxX-like family protein [Actinomadura madurae]|uniref:DoxX-like family protein n=1 Tax=Actinomadura madurae TaxID=1993 RepID=A0A1I5JRV8_9ACTN|nr:DoxX family protein [Actinomadura madurae]SFO75459.1 DoxX-like family protein [Actinomadura madurae]
MSTRTLTTAQTGTAQTAPGERRTLRRVLWGAQIFIAAFLLFASALPKFAGQAEAVRTFEEIGWGQWFRYVTGAVEAAGAIGLVVPRLAGLAAAGLIGLMAGAALTQLLVLEPAWALMPAGLAVVFAAVVWDRRAESREVLRSLKR